MNGRKITLCRRIVQVVCLILIIYGGYLFKSDLRDESSTAQQGSNPSIFPSLKAPQGNIKTTAFKPGQILWPSGDTPVTENYPPGLVCRFNPRGGMFKACIVHFVMENTAWQTPIKYLLPHITLFILLCFLLGRIWCGWVCPIGSLGDALTALRRRMNIPVRRFPSSWRRNLRFSSYSMLSLSFVISTLIGMPAFKHFQCYYFLPYCQICPARLLCPLFGLINPSWKDFTTRVTTVFTLLAWLMLALFSIAFYWGRRIWCHLCPVGLMNSWFNRGAGVELTKRALKCNKCAACADACPMGLDEMYQADSDVRYNQQGCIMCLRCVEACPREDCLSLDFFGRKVVKSGLRYTGRKRG